MINNIVFVYLKEVSEGQWSLYNEQDIQLTSPRLENNEQSALEWADAWASSWRNIKVKLYDSKKDRVSK